MKRIEKRLRRRFKKIAKRNGLKILYMDKGSIFRPRYRNIFELTPSQYISDLPCKLRDEIEEAYDSVYDKLKEYRHKWTLYNYNRLIDVFIIDNALIPFPYCEDYIERLRIQEASDEVLSDIIIKDYTHKHGRAPRNVVVKKNKVYYKGEQ